jgi:hypothetical protein
MVPAHAAMVSNDALLQQAQHQISVEQLTSLLERGDIQKQLVALGVDPIAARDRISRMNDAELAQLNHNLEKLPAGSGSGIVGLLLIIFIVFIITDMLGATDIFPFVKKITN